MELLGQHFDTAFSAPNGIQKLRELILTLGMQGKLVPQDPRDAPASHLLKEVEAEKKRLGKQGKIKAPKPLPEITTEEIPGNLPDGWAWVRNGFLFGLRKGKVPKDLTETVGSIPYLDIEALDRGNIRRYTEDAKAPQSTDSDILVVCDGSRSGLVLDGKNGAIGSTLSVIETPLFIQPFVKLIFRQGYERMNSSMKGAAIPHLDSKNLLLEVIGLPPLAEQKRILKKIDQLMARCDALENLRNEREKKRLATHAAALSQLLDTTVNGSADDPWVFISQYFGDLYAVKENVTELRKAILQLAITGRLSSPMETDSEVATLVEKLQIEQSANLSLRSKERDEIQTALKATTTKAVGNRVNLSARLFCEFITKGTTPAADELKEAGDIPFLKVYNIVGNKLDFDYKPSFVSRDIHQNQLKRSIVRPGDVVMNIVGPPLGKVAVVTDQFPEWNMNQALAVFRPLARISSAYIYYALSTNSVLESVLREVKGTAGQDNLSLEQCRDLVIPIPSIEEQHRTVAKIDRLMELCDTLEQRIDSATVKQTELLSVLMFDNRKSRCA